MRRGPAAWALLPLSGLFAAVAGLRRELWRRGWLASWRAPVPVVVIGNVTAGGSGKTPLVAHVAMALRDAGWAPGIVSRGYRRRRDAPDPMPVQVDSAPDEVGDEPLLLRRLCACPVWVGSRRARAAQGLLRAHPEVDVLLSDDGLQHFALARDVQLVVLDGRGTGNGWPLPAGPLRERATRPRDATLGPGALASGAPQPFFALRRSMGELRNLGDSSRLSLHEFKARFASAPVCAAAAIGHPEQFFGMLRHAGLELARTASAPDHQALSPELLAQLPGLVLMTEKDALKCSLRQPELERLWAVQLRLEVDPGFVPWLLARLARATLRPHDGFTSA